MTTRAEIAMEAQTWVGTPWHHQASLKGIGSDCIGLIVGVAEACGIPEAAVWRAAPESRGYARQPDPPMLLASCDRYLDRIEIADAILADILLMRPLRGEDPQHFGIISREDPRYIVHAYAPSRKVVEHRMDEAWFARIMRAYRFRGLY